MAVTDISLTGSGRIGHHETWVVSKDASPRDIGGNSGSVGQISVSVETKPRSKYVVNDILELMHPLMGKTIGRVSASSNPGPRTQLSAAGLSSIFNSQRYIPAVGSGSPIAGVDLMQQLYRGSRCTLKTPNGRYFSMSGHDAGFDSNGNLLFGSDQSTTTPYHYTFGLIDYWTMINSNRIVNGVTGLGYELAGNGSPQEIYATAIDGEWMPLTQNDQPKIVPVIMYKLLLDGGKNTFSYIAGPDDANLGTGKQVTIEVDHATATLTLTIRYRSGGIADVQVTSQDISTLDLDSELQILIAPRYEDLNQFGIYFAIANTNLLGALISDSTPPISTTRDQYLGTWRITGKSRALYLDTFIMESSFPLPSWMVDYESPNPGYTYSVDDLEFGEPILGGNFNGWQYLNDIASANWMELSENIDGGVMVLDVGARSLDIGNAIPVPSLEVNNQSAGLNIDVVYQDTSVILQESNPSDEMPTTSSLNNHLVGTIQNVWDAHDHDRIYTVKVGEVIDLSIQVDATVTLAYNPTPSYYWDDLPGYLANRNTVFGAGRYVVSDSDNAPVPFQDWLLAGASVAAAIDPITGYIDLHIVGPSHEIADHPGPYSFSVRDGDIDVPTLTVAGRGVLSSPKVVRIGTGASTQVTQVELVDTINNPAIATLGDAYDRGIWAAASSAGPEIELSITLPIPSVGFHLIPGSLIEYDNCILRVESATMRNASMDLICRYFTTIGKFDSEMVGKTIGDFDAWWDGFDVQELKIEPLRKEAYAD